MVLICEYIKILSHIINFFIDRKLFYYAKLIRICDRATVLFPTDHKNHMTYRRVVNLLSVRSWIMKYEKNS